MYVPSCGLIHKEMVECIGSFCMFICVNVITHRVYRMLQMLGLQYIELYLIESLQQDNNSPLMQ